MYRVNQLIRGSFSDVTRYVTEVRTRGAHDSLIRTNLSNLSYLFSRSCVSFDRIFRSNLSFEDFWIGNFDLHVLYCISVENGPIFKIPNSTV